MSAKPKVVYWNISTSPYVEGRFNAVARRDNLRLQVLFTEARLPERSWEVNPAEREFPARVIPVRPLFRNPMQVPVSELLEIQPDVMISGYWTASWTLGAFAALGIGTRTVFSVLPGSRLWSPPARWKDALKRFLFRAVDGVAVPRADVAEYARRFGMAPERIFKVTESIDVDHFARALDTSRAAREQRRRELGLNGCVFVYVGRLRSEKGIDFLFDAYREVRRQVPDVSLLMVGDGVHEARYREIAREMPAVVLTGFIQAKDLPEYYALADVMVFPTLGDSHGLVVEEGMAAGLPVICTDAAGGITHRLPHGRAGYVVPPRDASALAQRMSFLAADAVARAKLGEEAARIVRDRGHERFAEELEILVERILAQPRRATPQAMLARKIGALVLSGSRNARVTPFVQDHS